MRLMKYICLFSIVALMSLGCSRVKKSEEKGPNSVYYWKTTFELDSFEVSFLEKHNIERIYMRMFDVALQRDILYGEEGIEPIATTKFISQVPENIEIVPVTYITLGALKKMQNCDADYASLIVERLLAMCNYNKCGEIKEIQFDCDWTETTKFTYDDLCRKARAILAERGIKLSATIRLHQLREMPPPVDKGVLMLYNTGSLKGPETRNSILDIKNVKPYMKKKKLYRLPLAYAYPLFGWGVKFKDDKFVSIVSESDSVSAENEYIRRERPTYPEIYKVKAFVESRLGQPTCGNILYHLDDEQLKNYTDEEIDKILAY